MKKVLIFLWLLFSATIAGAQSDPEYRMEIGAGVGLLGYLGDYNGKLTKDMQPMGAVLARYNFNPYMGIKVNAIFGKLKGSSTDTKTYYPDYQTAPYSFDNTLFDMSFTYEYNFWPYGTGRDYRGAKRFTPFVFGGLGGTFVTGGSKSTVTANFPIGVGVKYKVGERINVGLEWAMHFSLSDKLDGSQDPYHVVSSGAFKNTDCYSALQLTLTYSFMAKCRTCHNQDE